MLQKNGGAGALAGLKVVDLTRVLGGPYCTQVLADHGATVIKIEPPQGDEVRDWGPPFHEGDASYFIGVNRNKRSVRSEEHTSELQSLMRISYAVFCLKNNKTSEPEYPNPS